MKKNSLIIALTLFILASATATANNSEKDISPIGSINFTDRVVYILDHTSNSTEGNWIIMGRPYEGKSIQLPQPIRVEYTGPKFIEYHEVSGTLYKDENEIYKITYPSSPNYLTLPVYLPGEKVNMSFYGDSYLKGKIEIYLLNTTSDSIYGIFDSFTAGSIGNLDSLFHSNMDGEYKSYSTTLGKDGDILDYSFGPLDPGKYCILMIQENEDSSLTVLSATAFIVTEYELGISSPASIVNGENLDISLVLENAPNEGNYTYGAALISEEAYRADIKIDSDGTRNGTSVTINNVDLIDEFDINSSNYRSKLTRDELQEEIQTLMGKGKGSIAIGEKGQKAISLTAFDLPSGRYYIFAGAYTPEKGLVGLAQTSVDIKSKGNSGNNDGSGNGGNNGNGGSNGNGGHGGSPEPSKNVRSKELCQQFIISGKWISFKFVQKATPIEYVSFSAKKTAGKVTAIVEELKAKSSLALNVPEGEVYKYVNIWIGNKGFANPDNIENAVVGFRVGKDWITENDINPSSITLQRYNGKEWDSLPTKKLSEDQDFIYFEAETPGFSPFAITAEKNIMVAGDTGEIQIPSKIDSQNESGMTTSSDVLSQESANSGISKIVRFFIMFLIVILVAVIIKKRLQP